MYELLYKYPYQLVAGERVPSSDNTFRVVKGVRWVHRLLKYEVAFHNGTVEMCSKIAKMPVQVVLTVMKAGV